MILSCQRLTVLKIEIRCSIFGDQVVASNVPAAKSVINKRPLAASEEKKSVLMKKTKKEKDDDDEEDEEEKETDEKKKLRLGRQFLWTEFA